eukprot:COSAG01_NODE_31445_length_597_cov_2.730924_1_plen_166_part_01
MGRALLDCVISTFSQSWIWGGFAHHSSRPEPKRSEIAPEQAALAGAPLRRPPLPPAGCWPLPAAAAAGGWAAVALRPNAGRHIMLPSRRTPPIARGPSFCAFEDLPDSLALRVLAHLSSTQAQLSGQRVCRRWHTLTRSLHARGELAARVIVTCSGDNTVAVIDPA